MNRAIIFALTSVLAIGCGNKKDEPKKEPPPPAGSAVPMTGSAGSAVAATGSGSAAGSNVDVPTEVDFEAKAKTDITKTNVDSKVKAIEDQLGQQ